LGEVEEIAFITEYFSGYVMTLSIAKIIQS